MDFREFKQLIWSGDREKTRGAVDADPEVSHSVSRHGRKKTIGTKRGSRARSLNMLIGHWSGLLTYAGCCFSALAVNTNAAELPRVRVTHVRRVCPDGHHNAFTDLTGWQGKFWLTFRSCPDGHMVHPTSSILVLSSTDTRQWKQEHRFSVSKRDTRDPHFLSFQDKLFVYTGTWYSGEGTLPTDPYDLNKHLGFAVWTADGKAWAGPHPLEGTDGHYIWRAATHDGRAYLCGRRNRGFAQVSGERDLVPSAMLVSDDGLIWRFHSLSWYSSYEKNAQGNPMTAIYLANLEVNP